MPTLMLLITTLLSLLATEAPAESQPGAGGPQTPVVVVVLSELPVSSLMNESEQVDPLLYPAFAELAAQSTWARRASTVSTNSMEAVSAILTGTYPSPEGGPAIEALHPDSLFKLLGDTHTLNVMESETVLHANGRDRAQQEERLRRIRHDTYKPLDQVARFRSFAARIEAPQSRPDGKGAALHFIHVKLPRLPWRYTPTGQSYSPSRLYGTFGSKWLKEPWWPEEGFRRHIMQLRFTDTLLGELIEKLRAVGMYDSSLIVVTSDFGAGFRPGESIHKAS